MPTATGIYSARARRSKVFEDSKYLYLRKAEYLQATESGARLYQSLFDLSADALMERQAKDKQIRLIVADHVPLLEKLSPEQLRDFTQLDRTRSYFYNFSACRAAVKIIKTPALAQKILNSDLPSDFLWNLPDLRMQVQTGGGNYDDQFDLEFAMIMDNYVLIAPELHQHMQPKHLIALAEKKFEYAHRILINQEVDIFENVLKTQEDKDAFLEAVMRRYLPNQEAGAARQRLDRAALAAEVLRQIRQNIPSTSLSDTV